LHQHATCLLAHICTHMYVYQRPPSGPVQVAMKIIVATGSVKSSTPVATMIRTTWQRLNIATGAVMASTRCYYDICVQIWHLLLPFTKIDCQQNLLHRNLRPLALACQWAHVHAHVQTETQCERKEDRVELKTIRHLRSSHSAVGL
jgi:hypothetical protein